MPKTYACIRSSGMYVPERIVKNDDLPTELNTNDQWIQERSGIRERRYADTGVRTSDLAGKAVENLLAKNEIRDEEIDCMIFATLSPDFFFPGACVFLQEKLGWADREMACYDIRQQCSGFIYGLQMAQAFVENQMYQNVLLVGAEIHSHGLEFAERGRAVTVLFGDGAAACVVSASTNDTSRILVTKCHADGRGALTGVHMKMFDFAKMPIIDYNPADPSENRDFYPDMPSPRNLFSNAVRKMSEVSLAVLKTAGLGIDDVDWVLPHQANMRINKMVADQIHIPQHKVLYNIFKFGNTTAATIPLLLAEYTENGTIKRGDLMLMVAFGSGFTWGAGLVRY